MKVSLYRRTPTASCLALLVLFFITALLSRSQTTSAPEPPAQTPPAPGQLDPEKKEARKEKADEQLKAQEHQRILGVLPSFNVSNVSDAVPLTRKQKFQLAFHSAVDPAAFLIAAIDGGYGQLTDGYHEYGQGVGGYFSYFGAAYADSFDGTILGNALFPSLLHEDPRYFRKGVGSFRSRLLYAMMSTVRSRTDSGRWGPNVGNLMGNLAAGGIANFYYPESDRGVALTFERAFTVTAEGAFGAMFYEFWPDITRHYARKRQQRQSAQP